MIKKLIILISAIMIMVLSTSAYTWNRPQSTQTCTSNNVFGYNIYLDQALNTTSDVTFNTINLNSIFLNAFTGKISAKDWSNVSITTSQITDYSPSSSFVYSEYLNQPLNTSSSPIFNNITIDGQLIKDTFPLADGSPEYWNPIYMEFLVTSASAFDPMVGAAISSGVVTAGTGNQTHPGIINLRDSTTANGGYRIMTDATAFVLAGTERARFIFIHGTGRSTAQYRLGFQDSTSVTFPTDGCFFNIVGNTMAGWCKNNAVFSVTAVNYTLLPTAWYDARLEINAAATEANFSLYNDAGALLWTQATSGNIPITTARATGFGIIATESTVDAAANILTMDFLNLKMSRRLGR